MHPDGACVELLGAAIILKRGFHATQAELRQAAQIPDRALFRIGIDHGVSDVEGIARAAFAQIASPHQAARGSFGGGTAARAAQQGAQLVSHNGLVGFVLRYMPRVKPQLNHTPNLRRGTRQQWIHRIGRHAINIGNQPMSRQP